MDGPRGFHSTLNMSSYIQVFILLLSICSGPVYAKTRISIITRMGSSALLPCDWREISSEQSFSQSPRVEWRTISGKVLERSGEQLYQSEGYKGRVDVPEDRLLKGDCSLMLRNIRAEDAGVYESFLVKPKGRGFTSNHVLVQSVELLVVENLNLREEPRIELPSNTGVIHSLSSIITFILLSLGLLQFF